MREMTAKTAFLLASYQLRVSNGLQRKYGLLAAIWRRPIKSIGGHSISVP
jgi:hypothetical protein